jgi:hypothetical protein
MTEFSHNPQPEPVPKKPSEMSSEEIGEMLRKEYLETFLHDRNDLIDDIPPELITHADPNCMRYKCRGNVFNGFSNQLAQLLQFNAITSPEAVQRAEEFRDYWVARDKAIFFVREEIDYFNETLDIMIAELTRGT